MKNRLLLNRGIQALAVTLVMGVGSAALADDFPLSPDLEGQCRKAITENYFEHLHVDGFDQILAVDYDPALTRDSNIPYGFGWIVTLGQKGHPEATGTNIAFTQLQQGRCIYVVPGIPGGGGST